MTDKLVNFFKKHTGVIVFLLVVLIIVNFFGQDLRLAFKALILTGEFSPKSKFNALTIFGEKFSVDEVVIGGQNGKIAADLYYPVGNKKRPAVIFLLGTRGHKRDENVKKNAVIFAKAGFEVLVPDLEDLIDVKMRDYTVDDLVSLFNYLASRDFVDGNNIGFAGICAGASMSLLAASDTRINDRVRFVSAISPYFDVWDFSRESFTKMAKSEGKTDVWTQNPDSRIQLELWYASQVSKDDDQRLIREAILDNRVLAGEEFDALSPDTKAIYKFLQSDNDSKFEEAKKSLPENVKFQVEAMSPRSKIGFLKAKVFILADSQDKVVPPTHSKRLAENLPKSQVKFSFISSLRHVVLVKDLSRLRFVIDGARIYFYIYSFLQFTS